jgi:hypothetical protein
MPRLTLCLALLAAPAALWLAACNPSLNWREVRQNDSPLVALMPCKPEPSSRTVRLGGHEVAMKLNSCTTDDATFIVGQATVATGNESAALDHWKRAALGNISVTQGPQSVKESALKISGMPDPQVLLNAIGNRGGGPAVQFNGLWFARHGQLFHAAIYASTITQDMSEPFFGGLRLP